MSKQSVVAALPMSDRVASRTQSRALAVFALVAILFVAMRFWKITSFSLWGGEAFTMIGVKQTWAGMFSYIIADIVHPPLSYVLLKIWVSLGGDSLLWLKLFPVLSGVALVIPFYFLSHELNFQWPETSLALFLAAVNGYLIHYAQELRMYSLFTFLSMCSFWLFMRYFNSTTRTTNKLVVLTLINLLNIYTHYYGWVVVGMEFLFLLIWQRRKLLNFGLSVLILLLVFAPWAYQVIRAAQLIGGLERNLDWIPKPHILDILNFYATLNGPLGSRYLKIAILLLFGLPPVLWLWQIIRSDYRRSSELMVFSWLAMLSVLPVIVIFLISQRLEQAVWIDRYFIFIAVPYLMLVAAAVYRLEPMWLRYTWIALIVIWSLVAGLNDLRTNRMAWEGAQMGSRIPWADLTQQLIAAETDPSGPVDVYTFTVLSRGLRTGDWASSTSLDYFLDSYGDDRFRFVYARDVKAFLNQPPADDHFWIAFFELAGDDQRSPAVLLAEHGYRVGDAITFQQVSNRVVLLPVWKK